ncbi:MAG TPA: DUF4382 domain-containing protein [Gammaproteobacteria bacterium]|nr:DUF4382 domain-containing protein [Gammaproteobacteria bacterium]
MKSGFGLRMVGASALAATVLGVAGCGGGSSGGATGSLTLGVADGPVDGASHVVVEFTGVEVHGADGTVKQIDYAQPRQIDLLQLTGGVTEKLLDSESLPAGSYNWIRLKVNDTGSYIVPAAGGQYPLTIPSGAQSGLKLNRGFAVPDGGHAAFTVDFDLRKSVTQANGSYKLRPTLRLVDDSTVGALRGSVSSTLLGQCASAHPSGYTAAVYVFADGTTPADVDTSDPSHNNPVATADVDAATQTYTVPFLEQDSYTAAFTCDAAQDTANQTDPGVSFSGSRTVTITAGKTTTADFP